jgi:hypothetical protein
MNASAASGSKRSCTHRVAAWVSAFGRALAQPNTKNSGSANQNRSPATTPWRSPTACAFVTSPAWVSRTAFGSAELPLVNSSSASASGEHGASVRLVPGASGSPSGSAAPSGQVCSPGTSVISSRVAASGSASTTLGVARRRTPSSSSVPKNVLSGTAHAPAACAASSPTHQRTPFGSSSPTRSPGRTPAAASRPASSATRSAVSV